jgi:hypothetical protein
VFYIDIYECFIYIYIISLFCANFPKYILSVMAPLATDIYLARSHLNSKVILVEGETGCFLFSFIQARLVHN